jgi:hypothetical protein
MNTGAKNSQSKDQRLHTTTLPNIQYDINTMNGRETTCMMCGAMDDGSGHLCIRLVNPPPMQANSLINPTPIQVNLSVNPSQPAPTAASPAMLPALAGASFVLDHVKKRMFEYAEVEHREAENWRKRAEDAELEVARLRLITEQRNTYITLASPTNIEPPRPSSGSGNKSGNKTGKKPHRDSPEAKKLKIEEEMGIGDVDEEEDSSVQHIQNRMAHITADPFPPVLRFMRDVILPEHVNEQYSYIAVADFRKKYAIWRKSSPGYALTHFSTHFLLAAVPSIERTSITGIPHAFGFRYAEAKAFFDAPSPFQPRDSMHNDCLLAGIGSSNQVKRFLREVYIERSTVFQNLLLSYVHVDYLKWCIKNSQRGVMNAQTFSAQVKATVPNAYTWGAYVGNNTTCCFDYKKAIEDLREPEKEPLTKTPAGAPKESAVELQKEPPKEPTQQ